MLARTRFISYSCLAVSPVSRNRAIADMEHCFQDHEQQANIKGSKRRPDLPLAALLVLKTIIFASSSCSVLLLWEHCSFGIITKCTYLLLNIEYGHCP